MSTEDTVQTTTNEEPEQPSVRESIEQAFEKFDATQEQPAAPAAGAAAPAGAPPPVQPAQQAAAPAAGAAPGAALGGGTRVPPAPAQPALEALKAPASWKADLRERWNALPREVQSEIIRREGEHGENLREVASVRRFASEFNRITEPYRGLIEAEGANPLAAYGDYLRTSALLRTGTPQHKAYAIAQIIQQFGVPLETLDSYLAAAIKGQPLPPMQGGPQQQFQQPQQFNQQQQFRDPRLDRLLENMEAQQAEMRRDELATFKADPKHEFFEDVRLTMADVMDAAAKRGIQMSLDDAYVRACMIEPEVRKVIEQRGGANTVTRAAQTLAAARHAASSLPSQPAAPAHRANGSLPANPSVRQSIEHALDTLQAQA